jgi:hypothetical protein
MAINYPTSLDSFTNPSASSLLTSPSHAQQHSDINDAMEAVQTKLAVGNTVIGTYTDYSASLTFTNVTVGNGTRVAYFCRVNNFVHFLAILLWVVLAQLLETSLLTCQSAWTLQPPQLVFQ